jgi:hypothetical protein
MSAPNKLKQIFYLNQYVCTIPEIIELTGQSNNAINKKIKSGEYVIYDPAIHVLPEPYKPPPPRMYWHNGRSLTREQLEKSLIRSGKIQMNKLANKMEGTGMQDRYTSRT